MTGRTNKTNKAMNVQTDKTNKAMNVQTNKTNKAMNGHINFIIDPSGASRPRKYFFDSGILNYFQPALRTSGAGLLPSSC